MAKVSYGEKQNQKAPIPITLLNDSFGNRRFVADFFFEKLNFTGTNSDIAFLCPPLGDLRLTYTVHLWLVGKRLVDFL